MSKRTPLPVALTVAGSDSGGGAGIQADLKTFATLGVHGTSAITCVTAQNPEGVRGVQACSVHIVRRQIEAVFDELPPGAVKTGMLYSAPIIHAVAEFFRRHQGLPLVVDPVMVSTSGAQLLKPAAVRVLRVELLPLATLVTPNLDEAEILVGEKLTSVTDLRAAARELYQHFGCAALVKGGHLEGTQGSGGYLLRWPGGTVAQRAVYPGGEHARHGLHVFGGDCRAPGVGAFIVPSRASGQGIHYSGHRAEPDRRGPQRPELVVGRGDRLRHGAFGTRWQNRGRDACPTIGTGRAFFLSNRDLDGV